MESGVGKRGLKRSLRPGDRQVQNAPTLLALAPVPGDALGRGTYPPLSTQRALRCCSSESLGVNLLSRTDCANQPYRGGGGQPCVQRRLGEFDAVVMRAMSWHFALHAVSWSPRLPFLAVQTFLLFFVS